MKAAPIITHLVFQEISILKYSRHCSPLVLDGGHARLAPEAIANITWQLVGIAAFERFLKSSLDHKCHL